MRALLVALAVVLSACSFSPRDHALVAVSASAVIAQVGLTINAEMRDDLRAAGGESASDEAVAKLDEHWGPIIADYAIAEVALDKYEKAIRAADRSGDRTLLAEPARKLLGAWAQLGSIADRMGITLPAPPMALIKFVGAQ